MSADAAKATASRLRRDAYLYIRQSTLYQVANNTESTARQYDLRGRAVALGWPAERIHVIDIDQGRSGAHATDREGFQHLVAEVSMGRAGIVLGLECSRLARNNADWHKLLEICAGNDTLICDEDGLYDPADFNDRLVLGLKGTLSEAELHYLRARMQGGLLAKARRGELQVRLPVGLVYDPAGNVALDPDAGVRKAMRLLFDTFTATGSARATVKAFNDQQLTFPARHQTGPRAGELHWKPLRHDDVLAVLHNPRYAGAYVYGRRKHATGPDGRASTRTKPIEEWTVLIPGHSPGYIGWEDYERNQRTLAANAAARGDDRAAGPAREGPALLQGLLVCGRCGKRMSVRYHGRTGGVLVPDYCCRREMIADAVPACQAITGAGVDEAVARLALTALTPLALEVALAVSDELAGHAEQADAIRAAHVQRAQHAADQARRRYLAVDPGNRLVAETLEADWNARLRELAAAQDDLNKAGAAAGTAISDEQRQRVRALAADIPALWNDPATPMRERKRLIRLLVTDVTLTRHENGITAQVRLTGGQHHTLNIPRPLTAAEQHTTPEATIALIGELLNEHPFDQTARILNDRGLTGGWGKPFTASGLAALCAAHGIPNHANRLRAAGMLTAAETAADLGVTADTVGQWRRLGLLTARRVDGRGQHLYHPDQPRPDRTSMAAARRPPATASLVTSRQLAAKLAVTSSTINRWNKLGLIPAHAADHRGHNLYHPDQQPPTPHQITASQRPPGTAELITGGKLAIKLGVGRSTIYKWHSRGLIQAHGTDKTGRHLYHPDQQPPAAHASS